jgi:uroporphyrinogen III methyltransferase/synthase
MNHSSEPQPSDQMVYCMRSRTPVRIGHLAPGFIVYIGLAIADPYMVTVGGSSALSYTNLVISDDEALDRIARHDDLCLATTARTEVRPPDESAADTAARVMREVLGGGSVVRMVRGDPLQAPRIAEEAAECVRAGGEVYVLAAVSKISAVLTMAGICGHPGAMRIIDLAGRRPTSADVGRTGWVMVTCVVRELVNLSKAAREAGRDASEPVTIIIGAATLEQHNANSTVAGLADADWARKLAVENEVMVGFGPAGVPHPLLDGSLSRPLFGWKVLLPRTRESSGQLERRLTLLGAGVRTVDTLALEPPHRSQPMDRAIQQLVDGSYRWIVFASSLSVRVIFDKVREYGLDSRAFSGVRIAALSPMAGELLESWGLIPDLTLSRGVHTPANFIAAFPEYDPAADPMDTVFLPRTDQAADWIGEGMRGLGWDVDEVAACRIVRAAPPPARLRGEIKTGRFDAVVFTSSAAVRNMLGLAGKPGPQTVVCAIGPATAATCHQFGLDAQVVAARPGSAELVDALAQFASRWRVAHVGNAKPLRPSQVRGVRTPVVSEPV